MTEPLDELEMRIRQLEAERLRPVPTAPTPALASLAPRVDQLLEALIRDYAHLHPDPNEPEED